MQTSLECYSDIVDHSNAKEFVDRLIYPLMERVFVDSYYSIVMQQGYPSIGNNNVYTRRMGDIDIDATRKACESIFLAVLKFVLPTPSYRTFQYSTLLLYKGPVPTKDMPENVIDNFEMNDAWLKPELLLHNFDKAFSLKELEKIYEKLLRIRNVGE